MIRFVFARRLSYFDIASIAIFSSLFRSGHWGWAIAAIVIGLIISVAGEMWIERRKGRSA